MTGTFRYQGWQPAVLAALLVFAAVAIEQVAVSGTETVALHAADAALDAAKARIGGMGPIESRRDTILAGDDPLDPQHLVGGGGFLVHVGTDATACPAEDAERTVLVERRSFRGFSSSRGERSVVRCDPLLDRFGQVVGVLAVAAPTSLFTGSVWAVRILVGSTFLALFGLIVAIAWQAERTITALKTQIQALEDQHGRTEAEADELRKRVDELESLLSEAEIARTDADAGNEAKSVFLANMSHELRTPLNAVIGYAELLLEDTTENRRADVQRILDAAHALVASMNDILDVTKLEAGELDLERVWFDVRGLLSDLASSAERAVALGGNVLRLDIHPDVVDMRGDPIRVRQILANLLSNAAKFTENGEIVLAVAAGSDETLRFEVRDSGVGMDAAQLVGIFDPFVQADPAAPRTHGGLGLGLTIVGLLAEQMGGEVTVASELGVGSTFTLVVPHHTDTRAPAPDREDKGDASEEAR